MGMIVSFQTTLGRVVNVAKDAVLPVVLTAPNAANLSA